jgi:hypothetical protein
MKAIPFDGVTRTLGVSQGYSGLPVMDGTMELPPDQDGGGVVPCMTTKWVFTDEERTIIARGGAIEVRILGSQHPPISLAVEEPPRPAYANVQDFEQWKRREA